MNSSCGTCDDNGFRSFNRIIIRICAPDGRTTLLSIIYFILYYSLLVAAAAAVVTYRIDKNNNNTTIVTSRPPVVYDGVFVLSLRRRYTYHEVHDNIIL